MTDILTTWQVRLSYAQLLSDAAMDMAEEGDIVSATTFLRHANEIRAAGLEEKWSGSVAKESHGDA